MTVRIQLGTTDYEARRPAGDHIELYRIGTLGFPLKLATVSGFDSDTPEWTWVDRNRAAMPHDPALVLSTVLDAFKAQPEGEDEPDA